MVNGLSRVVLARLIFIFPPPRIEDLQSNIAQRLFRIVNHFSGNFARLSTHHVAQAHDSTRSFRGAQTGRLRSLFRFLLCFPLSLFSLSGHLLRSLGLRAFLLVRSAFLRLSALCLFFPHSFSFFFLLSYPLSLFRVPGRHFFHRGQDSFVRSILLKPPQGS